MIVTIYIIVPTSACQSITNVSSIAGTREGPQCVITHSICIARSSEAFIDI